MARINIRDSYKQWLIEQGLQTRTPSKHSSTVTEYLRRIDRICDKHYKSHNAAAWNKLAKNIASMLISYTECQNKEYFINKKNIDTFLQYFNYISNSNQIKLNLRVKLSFICQKESQFITITTFKELNLFILLFKYILEISENTTSLTDIERIIIACLLNPKNADYGKQIDLYKKAIKKFPNHESLIEDLILHVEYINDYNSKSVAALNKFHAFLSSPPANDNDQTSLHLIKLKDDRDDDKIHNCLELISTHHDDTIKCISVIHKTGASSLQIKAHPQMKGYLSADEVANILEIDPKTLWRLKKDGIFMPDKSTLYSEDRVNCYLTDHFHAIKAPYPEVDYQQKKAKWINRREAAKILRVTERTVLNYTNKCMLTYTDYAPKAPRYYLPEIEFLAKHKF